MFLNINKQNVKDAICFIYFTVLFLQAYRHVDNVAFENTNLVERFLNYWRITGHQRIGFLYGTYEIHADVPLGKSQHLWSFSKS